MSDPVASFLDRWSTASQPFDLVHRQELSRTGAAVRGKDLGPALWRAHYDSGAIPHVQARMLQAKLGALRGSMRRLRVVNPIGRYPAADPGGVILGVSTPAISAIDPEDGIKIDGLPAGYEITAGDFLSIAFGSGGVRTAYHQVIEDAVADGGGETGFFALSPALRFGVAIDDVVTLVDPTAAMAMVPGSADFSAADRLKSMISFDLIEVP